MKKCFYLLGFCMLLFLGACQEDDEVIQKEEQLPTLEEMDVALIAEESLNGWDAGFTLKSGYCVGKRDTIDGTSTLHFNYFKNEAVNGMTVVFDENDEILNIIIGEDFYFVHKEGEYIYLTQVDNKGQFQNQKKLLSPNKSVSKSRSGIMKLTKEGIETLIQKMIYDIGEEGWDKIGKSKDVIFSPDDSQSIVDGNYWSAAVLLALAGVGLAASGGGALVAAGLVVVPMLVDEVKDFWYESARNNLYGSASVSIINVSENKSNNYTVVLELTNTNSIPSKYYEWFKLVEYDNTVELGVVAGEKRITLPSYYHHEAITTTLLYPNISRRTITVTLPNKYRSETVFRPFLISDREYENKDHFMAVSRGKYIRYGDSYVYKENNYSSIIGCETTSANYEANKVQIKGYVNIFNDCKKDERWGVYFRTKNGDFGYFDTHNANLERSLIQFTPSVDELELDFSKWKVVYKKELGVYHIDEKGNYTYGEMKECEFVYYDEKPNIKFTHAEIIGTREEKNESGSRAAPGPGGDDDGDDDDDDDDDDDNDDDDKKTFITEFTQTFDVKGSLWIDRLDYVKDEGAPKFEVESGRPLKDGTYTKKGTIKYTAKMPNVSAITRYSITLKDGRQVSYSVSGGYYFNRLYWSGENKITDVDW